MSKKRQQVVEILEKYFKVKVRVQENTLKFNVEKLAMEDVLVIAFLPRVEYDYLIKRSGTGLVVIITLLN